MPNRYPDISDTWWSLSVVPVHVHVHACQSEAQQRRPRQATEASTSDELTETEAGVAVDDEGVTTSAASAPERAREDAGLAAEGGTPVGSTSGAKRAREDDGLAAWD